MRNAECGIGNGEWGVESNFLVLPPLRIPHSAFRIPHSPLPIPFLRLYDLAYAALPKTWRSRSRTRSILRKL